MRLIDADDLPISSLDITDVGYYVSKYGQGIPAVYLEDIEDAPTIEPEIKPIDYQDCANAMLQMWMDNIVTDGEYNRIMDRLNAFWEMSKDGN